MRDVLRHDPEDPIRNFLFEYYHFRPKALLRWTPGCAVALEGVREDDFGAALPPRKHAVAVDTPGGCPAVAFAPEPSGHQLRAWLVALSVMRETEQREPNLLCHGLHEWAMLYHPRTAAARGDPPPAKHQKGVGLRVSQAALNACVESVPIRCTHFDAYRFFAEGARPLNTVRGLSRATQAAHEQPGCVHAAMDLFKWGLKGGAFVDAEVIREALRLALRARVLDMRASPYDLEAWARAQDAGPRCKDTVTSALPLGLPCAPVRVETAEGRAEYRALQRELYEESVPVRSALIRAYERMLEAAADRGPPSA